MEERQVAQQRNRATGRGERDADRGGHGAVDAGGTAVGVDRHVRVERAHQREVANGVGGAHDEVVPGLDATGDRPGHVQAGRGGDLEVAVQDPVDRGAGVGVDPVGLGGPGLVHAPASEDGIRQFRGAARRIG